jgi:hypothetical protein
MTATDQARVELPYVPVKHPYESVRWAFFKWADIADAKDEQRTYLRRLRIVQTPWGAIYLHWIYLPDDDRDPHDHPCNFWSFVVRGGYREVLYPYVRVARDFSQRFNDWRRWSLHKMPIEQAHRITHLEPGTITLVFFGRRQREWGFYTADGFVPFTEYARAGEGADPFGA